MEIDSGGAAESQQWQEEALVQTQRSLQGTEAVTIR